MKVSSVILMLSSMTYCIQAMEEKKADLLNLKATGDQACQAIQRHEWDNPSIHAWMNMTREFTSKQQAEIDYWTTKAESTAAETRALSAQTIGMGSEIKTLREESRIIRDSITDPDTGRISLKAIRHSTICSSPSSLSFREFVLDNPVRTAMLAFVLITFTAPYLKTPLAHAVTAPVRFLQSYHLMPRTWFARKVTHTEQEADTAQKKDSSPRKASEVASVATIASPLATAEIKIPQEKVSEEAEREHCEREYHMRENHEKRMLLRAKL